MEGEPDGFVEGTVDDVVECAPDGAVEGADDGVWEEVLDNCMGDVIIEGPDGESEVRNLVASYGASEDFM